MVLVFQFASFNLANLVKDYGGRMMFPKNSVMKQSLAWTYLFIADIKDGETDYKDVPEIANSCPVQRGLARSKLYIKPRSCHQRYVNQGAGICHV